MQNLNFSCGVTLASQVCYETFTFSIIIILLKAVCKTEWNTFCDYVKETKQRGGDGMKVSGYNNRLSFHQCEINIEIETVHDISL